MKQRLKEMVVYEDTKIIDVLQKIDDNGKNGVFVISKKNHLKGVITDSDIRKRLLKNKIDIYQKAKYIYQKNYLKISFAKIDEKEKILLNSNKILIPIVKNKKLIDFVHTSDLFKENVDKDQRILIIGGLGYIGSVLTLDLLNKNYKVNILDKNFYGCHFNKKTLKNPNLKIIYGDCSDKTKLKKSLKNCTDVIHLGEIVGDPAVNLNENFSIKNNFESTVFVVSECIKNKINKFIFASSCSVYGDSKLKCNEKSSLNPVSLYAKCKIQCEKSILTFQSKDFCPVILRLSTVYGDSPRKRFDLVVNRFVIMALKKIKISLFGAYSWRPFISTHDVSRVLIKVIQTDKNLVKNQIFNVGGDRENYRIIDIITTIKKHLNFNFGFSKKVEDKRNYKVSFSKIRKKIKFIPKDSLKKQIIQLIKKYKKIGINEKNINFYNDKKIFKILNKK